ncbi:hypothetical protein [Paraliomyxa miuraensis]|uniref:hypothetical protein n=1 Tax=Paraliomyxa miuraensis TaxID=376150 RepID=UPI00224DDC9B|nr:hypothetical protein [Paraliomyxa miuraensis]MCX4247024.1 hypothetical protein [Paraliomyxa miuraensis]
MPAPPRLEWIYDEHDPQGLPRRILDPHGNVLLRRDRTGDHERLWLRLPDHRQIALVLDAADHAVLGRCDAVVSPEGETLALASAVDWHHPTSIPALDRPGALPPGAGTAILDLLAWRALRAGSDPLRYRGPYPSAALWSALEASFRVDEPVARAQARFLAGAEQRALAGTMDTIDVAFHPAPHVRCWPRPRICVQHRAGIERIHLDGHAFDPAPTSMRRLQRDGDDVVACIAVGPTIVAELLRLDPSGEPRDEPSPLPPAPPALCGTPLPDAVVRVLGEVVMAQAPRLLVPGLRDVLASARVVWGDPGLSLVRWRGDALELHGALVAALPTDPTALLGVLTLAVEGPLRRAAAARLARAFEASQA